MLAICLLLAFSTGAFAQSDDVKLLRQNEHSLVDTSAYYDFHINYWLNMHHFLWIEAFINEEADSTIIRKKLPAVAQKDLSAAINYYKTELINKDLRTNEYMENFRNWIITQDRQLSKVPGEFKEHMNVLSNFDKTYSSSFWSDHLKTLEGVLEENLPLIIATEEEFVDRITYLTRHYWDSERIRVDIVFVAKVTSWNLRNRPYTSLFPTHVVMNAVGENHIRGNWLELLYHESAHHLIFSSLFFVGGTIQDVVEATKLKSLRQLHHAYLFFFTGELTKTLLEKQNINYLQTYMVRNEVFSAYYPLLEKFLIPYMRQEITLSNATENILGEFKS